MKHPHQHFYNDLSTEDADYWVQKLKPMTFPPPVTPKGEAWRIIPIAYLYCTMDNALPFAAQKMMVETMRDSGAQIETETFESSHSPFLSMPDKVVTWIQKVTV